MLDSKEIVNAVLDHAKVLKAEANDDNPVEETDLWPQARAYDEDGQLLCIVQCDDRDDTLRTLMALAVLLPWGLLTFMSDARMIHVDPNSDGSPSEHPGDLQERFKAGDPRVIQSLIVTAIDRQEELLHCSLPYTFVAGSGLLWHGGVKPNLNDFAAPEMQGFIPDMMRSFARQEQAPDIFYEAARDPRQFIGFLAANAPIGGVIVNQDHPHWVGELSDADLGGWVDGYPEDD